MNVLFIERSTGEVRDGSWVRKLALDPAPELIVVGTGPGSFAGIRSALAFAQGYAIGAKEKGLRCEVKGLPSPCASVGALRLKDGAPAKIAVVGDARRDKLWVALFDGFELLGEIFQIDRADFAAKVPRDFAVATPDAKRIGGFLEAEAGVYLGEALPTEAGMRRFVEANDSLLRNEPLPIYLNPAVRD